jgi:hypothetical protein
VLVQDNLNTHTPTSLYEAFERYDLKLWTGTLHESATYPPA